MNLHLKNISLVLVIIFFGQFVFGGNLLAKGYAFEPEDPKDKEGGFTSDTVSVFHIAKDVSAIFLNEINGSVYNGNKVDTAILNRIFEANYTSNDGGHAYQDAINEQIKAQKGDFGINVKGDFTENFTPGLSVDEDLTFKRRFYLGLEWDIIKGGLFDASLKVDQLKMEAILKEYEMLELSDKDNYRYLFNYINYIFNRQKIEILEERQTLVGKQLKYTKELYHLRYVGWEEVLKYKSKVEDIYHQIYQYKNFNKHIVTNIPDTLLAQNINTNDLPLFDVNLDSLMKIYYKHHSEDTVTQIKLAIYKNSIKWWRDISLKPFVRYNMYINEFNAFRNYGSAGVGLSIPLRFHNKNKLIRAQEVLYQSEENKGLEAGDNELVNIYSEFSFKLKQIKDFHYKKIINDELIRKELVKKEYHDPAFNPVFTLGLIDDKKAIEGEILDLKKRMYINLVRLAFYLDDRTPTDFITVLSPSDFSGRYEGSVKIFVNAQDIKSHGAIGVVNYLWKNEFTDVLVENETSVLGDELELMIEKSKLANISYSIVRNISSDDTLIDIATNIAQVEAWNRDEIIGLHFELTDYLPNDTINELSEREISDWVSSAKSAINNSVLRLSIGVPPGLSLNLLNELFNAFDLVFVHDSGLPNLNRVSTSYAAEMNLSKDKFVLSLKGVEFADRIHLENYLASLYENIGLHNFSFTSFSDLVDVDYKTFEQEINTNPTSLIASVQNQIYTSEENNRRPYSTTPSINETKSSNVSHASAVSQNTYRIQVAASKKKLSAAFLKRYGDEDIREIKINKYYKYTIGKYSNEKAAESALEAYRSKHGNTAAFLVTY